ncbi:MAG: AAA family ATPase [Clostridium perfringens]|nr:AAA family ATPase [Clostridium perfringens]
MLMRFNVNNYRSFNERVEFNSFPGDVRSKKEHLLNKNTVPILKFQAIYGGNAAGKSNLVKAIKDSRNIIIGGIKNLNPNQYFKLNPKSKEELSEFEYEVEIEGKMYAYGFGINIFNRLISSEWLYELRKDGETCIFERNVEEHYFESKEFKDKTNKLRFELFKLDYKIKNKSLFLHDINNTLDEEAWNEELNVFKDVYLWFKNVLDVSMSFEKASNLEVIFDKNNAVIDILKALGIGITDYKFIDADDKFSSSVEEKLLPKAIMEDIRLKLMNDFNNGKNTSFIVCSNKELYRFTQEDEEIIKIETVAFNHASNNLVDFYLDEESDGTVRVIELIKILLVNKNKVFIIDEIDRSLHPNLTYKFIESFLELKRKNNVQLIVTTHEDRILDLNMLRRDEIWFADKDSNGATTLSSLENYKPRFDKNILRAYLDGRFGGVSNIKDIILDDFDLM